MRRIGAVVLVALVSPGGPECVVAADMCRCKQMTLGEYFERADEVLMARLVAADDDGVGLVLRMVVVERAWKVADPDGGSLTTGDTVRYRTAMSTASCGVPAEEGALYAVFAHHVDGERLLRVETCGGTRAARPDSEGDRWDFVDVPARFVHGQLDALSGLDHLRELGPVNLLGLLEIEAFSRGGTVRLHAGPDPASRVVATARSYDDLVTREVDYEAPAAVVTDRAEGWFEVALSGDPPLGRTVWIPAGAGAWHPYEELPIARLTYLTSAWSGHVWPDPGAGIPTRSSRKDPAGREEYPVNVLESAFVGRTLWFRVELLDGEPCTSTDTPRPELTGWVPGYGAGGDPTVWYYSRGC